MIIGSQNRLKNILWDPEILIGDQKIKRASQKEFLGVIVDENLNWHKHIDTQCKKISKNIENEIVDDFENHSLPVFKRLLKAQ